MEGEWQVAGAGGRKKRGTHKAAGGSQQEEPQAATTEQHPPPPQQQQQGEQGPQPQPQQQKKKARQKQRQPEQTVQQQQQEDQPTEQMHQGQPQQQQKKARQKPKKQEQAQQLTQQAADGQQPHEQQQASSPHQSKHPPHTARLPRGRRRSFAAGNITGFLLAVAGLLLLQWASKHGYVAFIPRGLQLPGGGQITVPLPSLTLQADDLVSALQVNLAARLDSLNLNLTVALPTLSMPVPDWLSMNGTTFNMRDILSQLPGMAGGDAEGPPSESESLLRPGKQLFNKGYRAKHPILIIPGFVTSGLELWEGKSCARKYFRQRMWGTMTMMQTYLTNSACWFEHMALDLETGLDPEGIKIRAAQGLEAVDFFIQGYWVWGKLVEALADIGYDSNTLRTAAFDWRLAIPLMEARDGWFTRLKYQIESLLEITGQKVVLTSHSYGENVARSFLHWVEERAPGWLDTHVEAHIAIAGTTLGVPKALTAVLSGEMRDTAQLGALASYLTNNLIPREARVRLFRSWASVLAMMPVGGPKIWGNGTWAPDDTPEMRKMGRTFGAFLTTAPLKNAAAHAAAAAAAEEQHREALLQAGVHSGTDPFHLQHVQAAAAAAAAEAAVKAAVDGDDKKKKGSESQGECEGTGDCAGGASEGDSEGVCANEGGQCKESEAQGGADGVRVDADVSREGGKEGNASKEENTDGGSAGNRYSSAVSGISSTFREWFKRDSVGSLLDLSQAQSLDIRQAIDAALEAAGPQYREHYAEWGAMNIDAVRNKVQGASNTSIVDTILRRIAGTVQQAQSATSGSRTPEGMKATMSERLALFPNALTTPLPHAPNMKVYCMYGTGLPTERSYHYVHPDGWTPGKDKSVSNSSDSGYCSSSSDEQCSSRDQPQGSTDRFLINREVQDPANLLDSGIQMQDDGDVTVPLISLGLMCHKGWRSKRLNPANMRIVSREYKHVQVPSLLRDPRGGPATGQHVDILGNEEMLSDVLRVATGHGEEVRDRIVSRIDEIAANVDFEQPDGWE